MQLQEQAKWEQMPQKEQILRKLHSFLEHFLDPERFQGMQMIAEVDMKTSFLSANLHATASPHSLWVSLQSLKQ